jgi:hypothetical protein
MIASATESRSSGTVKIQRRIGISKEEFLKHLKALKFSESDRRELKQAMEESARVFGHAGSH